MSSNQNYGQNTDRINDGAGQQPTIPRDGTSLPGSFDIIDYSLESLLTSTSLDSYILSETLDGTDVGAPVPQQIPQQIPQQLPPATINYTMNPGLQQTQQYAPVAYNSGGSIGNNNQVYFTQYPNMGTLEQRHHHNPPNASSRGHHSGLNVGSTNINPHFANTQISDGSSSYTFTSLRQHSSSSHHRPHQTHHSHNRHHHHHHHPHHHSHSHHSSRSSSSASSPNSSQLSSPYSGPSLAASSDPVLIAATAAAARSIAMTVPAPRSSASAPRAPVSSNLNPSPFPEHGHTESTHSSPSVDHTGHTLDRNGRRPRVWTNRRYKCNHCNTEFYHTDLNEFAAHVLEAERLLGVETVGRRFKCSDEECVWHTIGFTRRLEAQKHERRIHSDPTIECRFWRESRREAYPGAGICSSRWHPDQGSRTRHERAVHGNPWNEESERREKEHLQQLRLR